MRDKKILLSMFIVFFFTIFSLHTITAKAGSTTTKEAVVTATSLNVRSGAGTSYSKITTVSKGKVYDVVSTKTGWVKIRLSSSKTGWVSSKYVTVRTKSTSTTVNNKEAVVTATSLNVRSGAGTSYSKITTVSKGKVYDVVSTKTGWVKIRLSSSKTGWVSSKYVTVRSKSSTSTSTTVTNKEAVVTATSLNVRSGAGISYSKIATVSKGKVYNVISTKSGWVKIRLSSSKTGWVSSKYVTIRTKSSSNSSTGSTTVNKKAVITADFLNLRKSASSTSTVLASIPYGTQITISSVSGNWAKVKYGNKTGYVHTGYISYNLTSTITSYNVIADSLQVYQSKSKSSTVIYSAVKGEKLEVHIKDGNWYEVYLSANKKGYIYIPDNKTSEDNLNLQLNGVTILLDAGHGGTDPGATGADNSTKEKVLNLQVAFLLKKELLDHGATVVMTRDSDTYYSLNARTNLSNSLKPDAFISLHHDSASATASGFTVYYYHSSHTALAKSVSDAIGKTSSIQNRGIKYGNFHVLRENKYSAILIELGYMSNKTELSLLKTSSYQKKAAASIANGIVDYFTN